MLARLILVIAWGKPKAIWCQLWLQQVKLLDAKYEEKMICQDMMLRSNFVLTSYLQQQ